MAAKSKGAAPAARSALEVTYREAISDQRDKSGPDQENINQRADGGVYRVHELQSPKEPVSEYLVQRYRDGENMTEGEDFISTATRNMFERLRQEILTGQLPFGTRLRQAEVAARFGISTTPVREAFRELAALGLVAIHPHRGVTVHRPSAHELWHIYETRMLLEPMSVAWSAPRISDEAIEKARKLIQQMKEATTPAVGVDMNRQFHSLIAGACGNDLLHRMAINLLDLSTPYLVWFREHTEQEFARQAAEHDDILRACEQRDPKAAYQASMHHLSRLRLGEDSGQQAEAEERWLPYDLAALMQSGHDRTGG